MSVRLTWFVCFLLSWSLTDASDASSQHLHRTMRKLKQITLVEVNSSQKESLQGVITTRGYHYKGSSLRPTVLLTFKTDIKKLDLLEDLTWPSKTTRRPRLETTNTDSCPQNLESNFSFAKVHIFIDSGCFQRYRIELVYVSDIFQSCYSQT